MDIVHPAYATNKYWLSQINESLVTVPEWQPLLDLHPCDLQSSMLKKCVPADKGERRRRGVLLVHCWCTVVVLRAVCCGDSLAASLVASYSLL
jgi:hypothetical protein